MLAMTPVAFSSEEAVARLQHPNIAGSRDRAARWRSVYPLELVAGATCNELALCAVAGIAGKR
jgi:hypothetical protein